MATPKNQITLRAFAEDVEHFHKLHEYINGRSVLPAKAGDIHRAIYRKGLTAWLQELERLDPAGLEQFTSRWRLPTGWARDTDPTLVDSADVVEPADPE